MYFIEGLKNDRINDIDAIFSVFPINQPCTEIQQAVPVFFSSDEVPGVHVLIICTDSNVSEWNADEFRFRFSNHNTINTQLPEKGKLLPRRATRYCVHSKIDTSEIDNSLTSVMKLIIESASRCFGQEHDSDYDTIVSRLRDNSFANDSVSGYLSVALNKKLDASYKTNNCMHSLFIRLVIPYRYYSVIKQLILPYYIEYVLLAVPDDPRIENLKNDFACQKEALEKELTKAREDLNKVETILSRIIKDIQNSDTVPITLYKEKCDEIKELRNQINALINSTEQFRLEKSYNGDIRYYFIKEKTKDLQK